MAFLQIKRQSMVDSQSDSNTFSVRIVSIDHYMAPPIHGLDISYSTVQGGKVNEVPVIRIYGSTSAGHKTCLHIHGGGTVLDGSLQPYESHIPFILQFLIDYNLHGMGHMHLLKMQFRHPVPDNFSPRKSDHIALHKQHMDKLTCMPTDFRANSSCDAL